MLIQHTDLSIPANLADVQRSPLHPDAWKEEPITVVLYDAIQGLRGWRYLDDGAGKFGSYYAIGDFIQTYDDYVNSRALPSNPTHFAMCVLHPGSVLLVGRCSKAFNRPGGGAQAQFLEGPLPTYRELSGILANQYGHA
jgi:hypothetical protein